VTATSSDTQAAPATAERQSGRVRRLVAILLGPLWVRTFRDPVRDGHLRLDSLSPSEKHLARCGLVLLVFLLGSVLFSDVWRSGMLFQLFGDNALRFVPIAAFPVALLGLILAWAMICWGALDAAPSIRVLVAVFFLATQAFLAVGTLSLGYGSWVQDHGTTLIKVGYYLTPAALVLSALLQPLLSRRDRLRAVTTAVLRSLILIGLVAAFGTPLWAHLEMQRSAFGSILPGTLDGAFSSINSLLVPLVYVAAIAVIDFALDVSTSLTEPTRVLRRRWLLVVLVAVLAAKAVLQARHWDSWLSLLTYQPVAFVRTAVSVALLAGLVALVTRFPPSEDYALAKERTMYGSSAVLASPHVISVIGLGAALYAYAEFQTHRVQDLNDAVPYGWLSDWGLIILSLLVVAAGVLLMRRSKGGFGDELGSALVVVAAWLGAQTLVAALGLELGFSYPTVDVVVTAGVLALLVIRWRTLSAPALVAMTTLLVFSWLVVSRGDYISFLGGLLGLPSILVVVFGVVLTLASGSSFASNTSKRLPTGARPLLFVGYLLLSVTILFWVEVTHESGQDLDSLAGFYFLGIPMAAWLAGRRVTPPRPKLDG
jgi:hypothetical protein